MNLIEFIERTKGWFDKNWIVLLIGFIAGWFLEPMRALFNDWLKNQIVKLGTRIERFGKVKYKLSKTGVPIDVTGMHSGGILSAVSIVPSIDIETDHIDLFTGYKVEIFIINNKRRFKTQHNYFHKKCHWLWSYTLNQINTFPLSIENLHFIDNEPMRKPYYQLSTEVARIGVPLDEIREEFVDVLVYINDKLAIKDKVKIFKTGSYLID
ncbi:MAG TPA: hypothetical protein VLK22_00995 [Candidatus Udaeobacter sp.]|nr:hypothetical protein [Candidatus Udaeobacter sp.]